MSEQKSVESVITGITGMCMFRGVLDSLEDPGELGDIAVYGDETYIHNGKTWEIIASVYDVREPNYESRKIITQCRNCGAATLENGLCQYCGTWN